MANGRTDEQDTPLGAEAPRCRIHVWGLFGETHLGGVAKGSIGKADGMATEGSGHAAASKAGHMTALVP